MSTRQKNKADVVSDNWTRHEDQLKEYARIRELRGGKSIHQLVAEANAARLPRGIRPGRRRRDRGR